MNPGVQAAMNAPGFNADHMTCRPPREDDWPDDKSVDKTGEFLENGNTLSQLALCHNTMAQTLTICALCLLTSACCFRGLLLPQHPARDGLSHFGEDGHVAFFSSQLSGGYA